MRLWIKYENNKGKLKGNMSLKTLKLIKRIIQRLEKRKCERVWSESSKQEYEWDKRGYTVKCLTF